jgi:prevent-host-death family protein
VSGGGGRGFGGNHILAQDAEHVGDQWSYTLTMVTKKVRTIPAGEFKAKCLKLIDEVAETGEEIIITKRGKVRARIVPERPRLSDEERTALRKKLAESVIFVGDVVSPLYPDYEPPPLPGDEQPT